jgi:hypothetical protein
MSSLTRLDLSQSPSSGNLSPEINPSVLLNRWDEFNDGSGMGVRHLSLRDGGQMSWRCVLTMKNTRDRKARNHSSRLSSAGRLGRDAILSMVVSG